MDYPANLDCPAYHDIEDQVITNNEQPIPFTPKPWIIGRPTRSGNVGQTTDRTLDAGHARPGRARVVPREVVEDVEEILLGGGKIPDAMRPAHARRARSLRTISRCPIVLAPFAAWASASSSFRYSSSCACKRS
jgi:hypothetical protein